jgi:hypothetical protein
MRSIILFRAAILAALLFVPVWAGAQEDFPPPGIYIPCCSSGGTGGHTGATYGKNGQSAWRQVWGAAPGDIVTFQFVLRARSAGSLHAWPQTTAGTDMRYLGDQNNPYEHWGYNTYGRRDKGGDFCIDCPWQFTATDYNPWIYVQYWDSGDGWDVDLNVVTIVTPAPPPPFSIFPETVKATSGEIAGGFTEISYVMGQISRAFSTNVDIPHAAVFALLAYASSKFASGFYRIAHDPPDANYCAPTDEWIDPQVEADLAWVWPYDNASYGWLIQSTQVIEAYGRRAGTSADRAMSAAQAGAWDCARSRRAEAYQNLNAMGYWMWYLQWAVKATADANPDMDSYALGSLYGVNDWLAGTASWLEALQP